MADRVAAWLFWLAVGSLVYMYGGFALLVALVGRLRRKVVRTSPVTPSVSLVIAAYNEEAVIAERIANVLALDYPPDRLQVLVAADGCSDGTEAIVRQIRDPRVRLVSLPRVGKIRALDAAVSQATGDLLAFSDARAVCHPGALRALVRSFADPDVGGVSACTSFRVEEDSESSGKGEQLYWDYDTRLKQLESDTGSIVAAAGCLYAIWRSLYRPVTDAAVTDDFAISTGVIEQGYRLVFEPEARVSEAAVPQAQREFRRRVRLTTRGLRGVLLRRRLLNPFRYGFYSVVLFSHKIVRRLAIVPLALLAASSAWLAAANGFFAIAVLAQAFFYALALVGFLLRRRPAGRMKPFYIPFYYCMANAAGAVAVVQALGGRRIERWQPQRHASPPAKAVGA